MATHWDLFIDDVKDGGTLKALGALVLHSGIAEGLYFQLCRQIAKREGRGRVGEIHWSALGKIEAAVAKEWISHFLRGPMMFFVLLRVKSRETKLQAIQRIVQQLEDDERVPGGLNRSSTTVHLDLDDADPPDVLRSLRRKVGLLRAFKWDSRGSLLLQLSDVLLGIASADSDGSLTGPLDKLSEAARRKREILEHARTEARARASHGKFNAVLELDAGGRATYRLVEPARTC